MKILPYVLLLAIFAPQSTLSESRLYTGSAIIGVSEPAKEIDLAFPEVGIIASIPVEEGSVVTKGELLASLDLRVYQGREKIAAISAANESQIRSTEAVRNMRKRRLDQLNKLSSRVTNPDELARAEVEYETALSEHEMALDARSKAEIELEQIRVEMDRRRLYSPIDGIVTTIRKDVAESVGGGETLVMTVVELDELDIIAHVRADLVAHLKKGDEVRVTPQGSETSAIARVDFISPVVDASSTTRRMRLILPNAEGDFLSGVKYRIDLGESLTAVAGE